MSFASIKKFNSEQTFKKTEFIDLPAGQSVIRVIDESAVDFFTHYVKNITVKCLGANCPICKNNQKIYVENPKNYRNIPGYNSKSQRFYVNVLDKTLVKICPNCGAETKAINNMFPNGCSACNTMIVSVQPHPLNKVKVFSKGVQVFEQLEAYSTSILDESGEPLGLTNFDITIMVTKQGKQTTTIAIPQPQAREPLQYNKEDLFDLSKAIIELTESELLDLQRGVQLRDIFLTRNAEKKSDVVLNDNIQELESDIQANINELFG
jgi:hypothetical protein